MLCDACQKIFAQPHVLRKTSEYESLSFHQHHNEIKSFQKATELRCQICSLFRDHLQHNTPWRTAYANVSEPVLMTEYTFVKVAEDEVELTVQLTGSSVHRNFTFMNFRQSTSMISERVVSATDCSHRDTYLCGD
jgi:hypothetical protein